MPELLRCIECSTPITLDDRECPHCHTEYPQGVVCLGCFETLKQSAAVQHETHSTNSVKYFHAACYQKVIQPLGSGVDSTNESLKTRTKGNSSGQKRTVRRILKFLFLATIGFIFSGGILSLMLGGVGALIGFILAIFLTVKVME